MLAHGDFGLGTFNALDGELLIRDSVCYQLRSDGSATVATVDELVPFAVVTRFRPQQTIEITEPHDRAAVTALIDADRNRGAHALDYRLRRGTIELSVCSEFHLSLPQSPQFEQANLTDDYSDAQIRRTEGA